MSSDIVWRPIDVSKFGLIYAGAQKNLGPSGLVLVIVRKSSWPRAAQDIPVIFQYRTHAENNSLYNTPPTFSVYMLRNVLDEMKKAGGLAAVEKINREKAKLLYDVIDERGDFYASPVDKSARSTMNVVFTLKNPELEAEFLSRGPEEGHGSGSRVTARSAACARRSTTRSRSNGSRCLPIS